MKQFFSSCIIFLSLLPSGFMAQTLKNQITREPYLQAPSPSEITVRWRTNLMTRSTVFYGKDERNLNHRTDSLQYSTEHEVRLSGLEPDTRYYYRVVLPKDTRTGKIFSFYTLPQKRLSETYSFALFGDPGSPGEDQIKVRDAVMKYYADKKMDFWIQLGDNAYRHGTDQEFQNNFFTPFKEMLGHYPSFSTLGNHDYHDVDFGSKYAQTTKSNVYFKIFSLPARGEAGGVPSGNSSYYSMDVGHVHLISLDSYGIEKDGKMVFDPGSAQYEWLKQDLQALENHRGFIIVYTHFPPFSKGEHDSDSDSIMSGIRENLLPLLERYGVDLLIGGHSHVYERSPMMKGFYGKSAEFDTKYAFREYRKNVEGFGKADLYKKEGKEGIAYVVTGNSSATSASRYPDFPHRAMKYSNDRSSGACIVEVQKNQLTLKWLTENGIMEDTFVIEKDFRR
ncbi:metallophosphoesterase [Chryseobacterium koreense]